MYNHQKNEADNYSSPFYTIITTTYNRKEYLKECLESLYSQTFTNYEHIIVDGESNDGTYEYVKEIISKYPKIDIKLLRRESKGVYDAVNYGISKAKGMYINILNSDDYLYNNNVLNYIYNLAKDNNFPNYIQGKRYIQRMNGKIRHTIEKCGHQQAFLKREVHKKHGVYKTKYRYVADTELLLRVKKYEERVWTDNITIIQREHPNSLTVGNHLSSILRWVPELIVMYIDRLLSINKKPV